MEWSCLLAVELGLHCCEAEVCHQQAPHAPLSRERADGCNSATSGGSAYVASPWVVGAAGRRPSTGCFCRGTKRGAPVDVVVGHPRVLSRDEFDLGANYAPPSRGGQQPNKVSEAAEPVKHITWAASPVICGL